MIYWWLWWVVGVGTHRLVQFRETKAPTFPNWVVWGGPVAAAEVVNGPIIWLGASWSYRETTTGVRPDSCAELGMGVTTWRAVVRPVPVELSVPFRVSPVPLPVEIAFTNVSFPPCPVVALYRGSAVAPFVPAGNMLSSAPPGSRASSEVMVVVGELPLLYPANEPVDDIVVMPLLLDPVDELMSSLCSCALVIVWMLVGCGRWL